MALPVTISDITLGLQNSYHGPFKSSSEKFYTIGDDGTSTAIRAFMATDPTDSFAQVDAATASPTSGGTNLSINVFQVNDKLHVAVQTNVDNVYYFRFDMSSDTWDDIDTGDNDILIDTLPNGTADACDIAVLSASYGVGSAFVKIRVVYQGETAMDMGSAFERIDESNSVDGGVTWSTPVSIDSATGGAGVHYRGPRIVKHPSDDQCFIFFKGGANLIQRAIAGDDTLRTYRDTGFDLASTGYPLTHGLGFTRSSTAIIRIGYREITSRDLAVLEFDAFTDDTDRTETQSDVHADDVHAVNQSIVACLAVDGSTIRGLMAKLTPFSSFEFDDGDSDTYTLQSTAHVSGGNHISCNVYDRSGTKLAMIHNNGGTITYDEISIGGGTITMVAAQGSYALTGKAAITTKDTPLTAAQGDYALTGQDAITSRTKSIPADQGDYALTGQPANTFWDHLLSAAQGDYTLTGQPAFTRLGFSLAAAKGDYALGGQAANLLLGQLISAVQGAYALSGQPALTFWDHLLAAGQGAYALSGKATITIKNTPMAAAQGDYVLSGQAAILLRGHLISGVQGSYVLTGQPVGTRVGQTMTAVQGAYALTGQVVVLLWDHLITAVQGAYALSGQPAVTTKDSPMVAVRGLYALTGQSANLLLGHLIGADQGSYTLTGQPAATFTDVVMSAVQGDYTLSGQPALITKQTLLTAVRGDYALTGQSSNLLRNHLMTAAQGGYTLTGIDIGTLIGFVMTAAQGAYTLTGQPAALLFGPLIAVTGWLIPRFRRRRR